MAKAAIFLFFLIILQNLTKKRKKIQKILKKSQIIKNLQNKKAFMAVIFKAISHTRYIKKLYIKRLKMFG